MLRKISEEEREMLLTFFYSHDEEVSSRWRRYLKWILPDSPDFPRNIPFKIGVTKRTILIEDGEARLILRTKREW